MSFKKDRRTRNVFGATAPPFIDYLKGILRRYPDGGQILKELIQNADDAKATEVIFIHDDRSYGNESLWNRELGKYQGPALYAYNNAAFTPEDWEGIQSTGRSVKRTDPNKVGRFGIGFNSIYHITDLPSIFSSGHFGLLDPQEKIFGKGSGGHRWSLDDTEDQEVLIKLNDQFKPFQDIVSLVSNQKWKDVIMTKQHFEGALFRFPLRSETSEISDNVYNSDRVAQLFESFIADADLCPLFLRSVTSISLIHIKTDNSVNVKLEVKCSLSTDVSVSWDESKIKGSTSFKNITLSSGDDTETKQWLVTTCRMKEGQVAELDSLANKLHFLPQVDLAFPCGQGRECNDGRLSCFLPLPNTESNKTGLPVFVNACFGLTDNRRHTKWQEDDQKYDEAALWNESLVKEVLPEAYLKILQDAVTLCRRSALPVSSVYRLWPDISQMQHKNKLYAVTLDVLQRLLKENVAVLSLAAEERHFVTPSEAVFPCNDASPEIANVIRRTLVSSGENLVTIPGFVAKSIKETYPYPSNLRHVTPTFVRTLLRRMNLDNISQEDKLHLLEYVLSDGEYAELQGLQLLPHSDGTFRCFTIKEDDTALIDSKEFPRLLLPGCKNLFIPTDLSTPCQDHLTAMATRGLFKLVNMDAKQVVNYAMKYLPKEWQQTKMTYVMWDPCNSQHPPLEWLQEFWKFLNANFRELRCLIGMPLIPIMPVKDKSKSSLLLARLQQNSTIILKKNKHSCLPEQIEEFVKTVGGTVVRGEEWLKHENLNSYLLHPSPKNVIQVLVNLDSHHVVCETQRVSCKEKEILKMYLSSLESLSDCENEILSKMPLFQTMNGSWVAAQSKQAVNLVSGLTIPTELPLPQTVVRCANEADRRILQLLNIKILDTAQAACLLIDGVDGREFKNGDTEKIMAWILQHGNFVFYQNEALKIRCMNLHFIERNGEFKKISSFFDPRVETFKDLFEGENFPPAIYTETTQMLESLKQLGLINKETDVTSTHLLQAAAHIEKLHVHSQKKAIERFNVLIRLLDAHDLLSKFSKQQLQSLSKLKWVPCAKPSKGNIKSKEQSFFCPDEIGLAEYEDIVGHVMPLKGLSEKFGYRLGLQRLPPPDKVLENLSVLSTIAQKIKDPDKDGDFKRKLYSTYGYMQKHISEFSGIITDRPWLWVHNKFVSPKELVIDYPPNLDLSSYIGKVPKDFLPYEKLLRELGVRPLLSDEEIIGILHHIRKTIDGRREPFANSTELKLSIEILNWVWREKLTITEDIPVPVAEGEHFSLKPLSTAVFCDVSKDGLLELSQEEFYVIHDEISKAIAEWLNIPLLSRRILKPELVQCGQSEPITMRIRNILKEYEEESDIFKELIQNAEDARANTCRFMVDFRQHKDPPESLIDTGMAVTQGPCLWAFNDELFSEDDWKNIVKVGSASKEDMVEKIGKFGLGFNTVFHVTDVPSILSGNKLLILDPNITHLKKHIKGSTNPGIKLDLSQSVFKWFPGQFRPYEHIFNCNFNGQSNPKPYTGTLFKLPFRTQEEAQNSEICTKAYDRHKIMTFQHHFINNSQTHLLFLKSINTLSLEIIAVDAFTPPRDDQINTVFTVSKDIASTMKIPNDIWASKQKHALETLMHVNKKCKEVIDCDTIRIVEIKQQDHKETSVQSWLVYNCFGTEQSLQMVTNKQSQFFLPIGGVALPLHTNRKTGKWVASKTTLVGQTFCFLPLSIQTGLPVNVNGSFAVTSNRKSLWESGVKYTWNKALLQDPTTKAYITALLVLKMMSENKDLENYCYHTFWPKREEVSETFKPLVDAFYCVVAEQSVAPELFSDGKHWCSIKNAIFLHHSIEEDEHIGALAMEVCQNHSITQKLVVSLPMWVRNGFEKAGLNNILQSRMWNWEMFYQEVVFSKLNTIDSKTRNALVLHAIDLNHSAIDKLLLENQCVPTQNGKLQYIRKLVNPSGKLACLFEQEKGRLLGGTTNDFCSPKRIQRLMELGMLNDHLPLDEIIERAGTIPGIWCHDKVKAYEHLKCILGLIRSPLHDKHSPLWESLKNTTFISASMDKIVKLWRPVDVFSEKCSLLVSMTQPVLDHSSLKIHSDDPVLKILGICENPTPETVLQQLQKACTQSQSYNKTMLHNIALECYKYLDQCLQNSGNSKLISERAHSFLFILVGDKFVHVNSVAQNQDFEAKPYLNILPVVFTSFRNLWECVGVEWKFTVCQFLTVLQTLHDLHGNNPLPKPDLTICLTILSRGLAKVKQKELNDCLIPNVHGVLKHASTLYFNDSPWMEVSPGITLCHVEIPRITACHFGIKTTRHQTLETHIAENSFEFQQHEELTVRIKNIISAYPSKKDILKELIQNADDAEATEIHFVWDKRQHGTEKTFGEKWNHLQGPALCVYNNKAFSDADLAGIQQLGEGGKHNIAGKTGKYGIGFNSVYHLTDCPSILTRDELLCIFDPNKKYIEPYSTDKPRAGCGYRLSNVFKETYMDIYQSFLPDEFALQEGTMFRLPLRIGAMANDSQISNQGITERDMMELSSALSEDPEGLILFLKNIRKIQFHEIDEQSNKPKTIFMVEKSIPENSSDTKKDFHKCLQNALQSDKPIHPHQTIYDINISSSLSSQSEWIIAEQFGPYEGITEEGRKQPCKVPQAALAARLSCNPMKKFNGGVFCTLPLPGETGLPVHVDANFEVDSSRRDLWKEDGLGKKAVWNEALKNNTIAPLYACLLQFICCNTSGTKKPFSDLNKLTISLDVSYLRFFPIISKTIAPNWHYMIEEVYRSMNEKGLDVIPVLKSSFEQISHNVSKRVFSLDWCDVKETEPTNAPHLTDLKESVLNYILEDLGMRLVPGSIQMGKIWTCFKTAGVEVKRVTPSTVGIFLKETKLNDLTQTEMGLPLPVYKTLIKNEKRCKKLLHFCLKDLKTNAKNTDDTCSIDGLPLLLTKDKVLRVFDFNNPKLISIYDSLFIGIEESFADFDINQPHIDVLQDGNFVKCLTISIAVDYLKPILLILLQDCEFDPRCGLYVSNKRIEDWLKTLWRFFISKIKSMTSDETKKETVTLGEIKELFHDCCILPVVCPSIENKVFLQKMMDMHTVIHKRKEGAIDMILLKLGQMTLNLSFFIEMYREIHLHLQAELLNTSDKTSVLDQVCKQSHTEIHKLTKVEMGELQCFLQSGVNTAKDKLQYQIKLKSLPIFETIEGKRVRIDGCQEVFILNMINISITTFPEFITIPESNNVFLTFSLENRSLSENLDIQIITDLEYFIKFILPALQKLTESQILNCIKMLQSLENNQCYHKYRDTIMLSMKDMKLICGAHGKFEKASYYFDESIELYKLMVPKEKFVPQKVWDELCKGVNINYATQKQYVRTLLQNLGMKHAVSKEEIIQFAKQIELDSKASSGYENIMQKSIEVLTNAISIAFNDKKQDRNLLLCMADIKFIFPMKIREELCTFHHPFAIDKATVAISGSLIEGDPQHQDLIWTAMPIIQLPCVRSQKTIQMLKNAGALETPPELSIIENMSNISRKACLTKDLVKTRADVFCYTYAHLQSTTFNGQPLTNLPIVLVENDTKLVKSGDACLVLSRENDFRPYLYKINQKYIKYEGFFKNIGVQEKATVLQYCNVLTAIYEDSCDKATLQANQQKTIIVAVKQLFKLIKRNTEAKVSTNLPNILYLPSTDGKLYQSTTLYYNDTVWGPRVEEPLKTKVQILENLSACDLDKDIYKHGHLLKLLPEDVRPKMLSRYIEEKVVESGLQLCDHGANCEFRGWFHKHLTSIAFRHGIVCLIREHSQGKTTQEEALDMCQQVFGHIEMVCCMSVEAQLWFNQEPLHDTAAQTDVYVTKQEGCTFYLKHSDGMAPEVLFEIIMSLTKEIHALFGNIASEHLSVLGLLLMCDSMQKVQTILAKNGIHDSLDSKSFLNPPDPGTVIPEEWHDSLDMNIFNYFEEGEYVGYFTNEEYIYAIIVKQMPGPTGQYSYRYTILVGQDKHIEVSALDLYQFKREKKSKQGNKAEASYMKQQRPPESSEQQSSLTLSTSSSSRGSPTNKSKKPIAASLEEAKQEIDTHLALIWTLPEEERQKAIKRLYLRWHPDKNPDNQELSTEAFKYLQNKIDELTKGKPSNTSSPKWNTNLRDSYEQWNQEARRHRCGRERFNRDHHSHTYNFWTHHGNVPRPDREEAQRWCRQARCDLDAASKDIGGGSTEWCLFKVHQAVEKALIAAEYKKNGKRPTNFSISRNAARVATYNQQLRTLPETVNKLNLLGMDAEKTQYPNCHPFPYIPNERFKSENEIPACTFASELFSAIEAYVG